MGRVRKQLGDSLPFESPAFSPHPAAERKAAGESHFAPRAAPGSEGATPR